MRIRLVEIENFRGIDSMTWPVRDGMNCLVGPGDSTTTTILDAIELALNPRSYLFADDSDFYHLNVENRICITVTIGDLPADFLTETKYGLHLRGWNAAEKALDDEPGDGLESVLSIRVVIDKSLEARWGLYNKRIAQSASDPPVIRYKDMRQLATSRLGPFAERHLSWGRQSVLSQIEESGENVNLRLAEASRAARQAFKSPDQDVFTDTAAKVQELGKAFSVPVADKYRAELDIQSVSINTGGIALHDGELPLRRLGTGSSRLLVSALQHEAASGSHIALIDEVEHGLEPHRIARLLKFLKSARETEGKARKPQIFTTTHSPVVVCELSASDIQVVQARAGKTTVKSVAAAIPDADTAQRHLRTSPEAFLARRILVGEGKTEAGLVRGLDAFWTDSKMPSFAFQGVVPINGGGKDSGPQIAESLLDLGYCVALLLDSDEEPNPDILARVKAKGGVVIQWDGNCSTEERIFRDVPWQTVIDLIRYATSVSAEQSVLHTINIILGRQGLQELDDLALPQSLDDVQHRTAFGKAAKTKDKSWFKRIDHGEEVAAIIAPVLPAIAQTPLVACISEVRQWVDE